MWWNASIVSIIIINNDDYDDDNDNDDNNNKNTNQSKMYLNINKNVVQTDSFCPMKAMLSFKALHVGSLVHN